MKMVALKLINVIVLFVYFVKCSDVNEKTVDKKVSNAVQIPRTHFNNRPPSAVDSIPVVVIFEEENRKEKSVDLSVGEIKNSKNSRNQNDSETSTEFSNSENETEQILSISKNSQKLEPKFSKSTVESVDVKDIITVNETKTSTETVTVKTNTKQDPIQKVELQIPVAVIYDPEPKVVVNNDNLNRRRQSKRIEKSDSNKLNIQSKTAENNKINKATNSSRNFRNKIQVPILHSENFVYSHNGDFHYSYEGGDGTKAYESGKLKSIDDNTGEAVVGSFSYVGKDGNDYSLTYTADENGYRPVGAHLPTPPPIPPAIARALKYLATKTTPEPVTEPSKR